MAAAAHSSLTDSNSLRIKAPRKSSCRRSRRIFAGSGERLFPDGQGLVELGLEITSGTSTRMQFE
jgi:hypothetical protein